MHGVGSKAPLDRISSGKWRVGLLAGWFVDSPRDHSSMHILCGRQTAPVAIVIDAIEKSYCALQERAHLIAAAPDLLEALQMVCDSGAPLADDIERAMTAALRKARGAA